jgi:hypothetical protein
MTVPRNDAAARREHLLRRTRTITLGIAGGAAVASLGLGTALAHDIPGHARPAAAPAATSGAATSGHATSGHAAPARQRLAPPPRPPATTPAAPQASSGGS